ncbi:class I SAM-dependent methyltransferase [Marinobacter sp. JSM 1782161]|uniref:class I SAM-dependent methyltransferase n=1 Tax=Marinobacter sp. JSM 1782161 TaxID=2685906 RepID=UPI00140293CE|nr:class I SAM-dependent methyltransferase [Marinobacter sp. JSM 1782161]
MAHGDPESRILSSWKTNASAWIRAVREHEIASRETVTNQAIVNAILTLQPRLVLDAGCGEGWLVRALSAHGIRGIGIDATPELVEQARALDNSRYQVMNYAQLANAHSFQVDVLVCNFALLGDASANELLRAAAVHLKPDGHLVIQTLHPLMSLEPGSYQSGWREGTWAGFSDAFREAPPWYFRTLGDWFALFGRFGFRVRSVAEPTNLPGNPPFSILFTMAYPDAPRS